jgi:hypothetical protein
LHCNAENYIEAGFTLKLYADMLSWDNDTLTFLPHDNNGQPEWKRKEKLYQQIISYFDKGKCWEKGVPLCKELANFYETKLYDYNKLSDILQNEAKFFQNILTQIRAEPEYFRVGFFGKGFPLFVRVSLSKFFRQTEIKLNFTFRINNLFTADWNMNESEHLLNVCKQNSLQHNCTPKIHRPTHQ